jgi:chromate reductase, NAD(P)H dehydrogenase (quinone)
MPGGTVMIQVAMLVGSLRKDSINRKLAHAVTRLAPSHLSFTWPRIDDLPLYSQDDDSHPHPHVVRLKREIASAQGLIFATPEYNRSIPGVLKNAIDHASRPYGQSAWAGKPAGVIGGSIGAPGSAMAQQHLRNVLAYLDVPALGQPEVFVQVADGMFDERGELTREDTKKFLRGWMDRYVNWLGLHSSSGSKTAS